ncbi:AAA family ATPase [Gordonia tangerina]|uniref:AAA family ATPase n=1 Tax=Gordonia tangerina TaxID=2911060 RepID=A0ABS9DGQ2_9ACTN|nr:AAA family ATPase [Gordonia tangerina]MCF3938390.1 AAA family ATPase [Gordonia tangerina]
MTEGYELTPEENRQHLKFLAGAMTPSEIAEDEQHSRWLIDGYLASSATMVTGEPESGKTALVAAMAAAVARGDSEFLGEPVESSGPVLVITTDPGERHEWRTRADDLDVPDDRWLIADFDPARWDAYLDIATEFGVALVVFDNVTGALSGGINDADPSEILRPLTRIVSAGVPVVALHHSAKSYRADNGRRISPDGPMGPTAYRAWRRHGIHVADVDGFGIERRRLTRKGNLGKRPDVVVDGELLDSAVRFSVVEPERKPERSSETLDRNAEIARWVVDHCQGVTQNRAGEMIADEFDGISKASAVSHLSRRTSFGALLARSGAGVATRWSLET